MCRDHLYPICRLPSSCISRRKERRRKERSARALTTAGTVDREERRPLHPRAPRREIRILRENRAELRKGVSFHAPDRRYVYSYVSLARIFSVTLLHAALFVLHFTSPPFSFCPISPVLSCNVPFRRVYPCVSILHALPIKL